MQVGDRTADDAAYSYEQPPGSAAMVKDLIAFVWDAMDAWFEEDEEVFVHSRDPYHRIDVLRSSRHVVLRWGDTVVADSTRPRMLLQTGLPVRWYLPREDVRTELLAPSYTTTRCPYKGVAQYWTLRDGDREERDVVWSYPDARGPGRAPAALLHRRAARCRGRRRPPVSDRSTVLSQAVTCRLLPEQTEGPYHRAVHPEP